MEVRGSLLAPKRKPLSSQAKAEGGWGFKDWVGGAAGGKGPETERRNTVVREGTTPPEGGRELENSKMQPAAPKTSESWRDPRSECCPVARGSERGQNRAKVTGGAEPRAASPLPPPSDPNPGSCILLIWQSDLHNLVAQAPAVHVRRGPRIVR